ncbi:MAG: hypothetical protein CTY16_16645 [Methylobacter sp.]|nr:MAG: hypothetical protein CTY16_16645 [Methylobacter sp.]
MIFVNFIILPVYLFCFCRHFGIIFGLEKGFFNNASDYNGEILLESDGFGIFLRSCQKLAAVFQKMECSVWMRKTPAIN